MLDASRRRQALREIENARQCGFVSDFDARLFADLVARKKRGHATHAAPERARFAIMRHPCAGFARSQE